ncbi:hypothetical protein Ae201684P_009779 [Aphanomyces euteiches]|nr:hypothetical protein Ae201684P_009779 [Aphanomyces euteiches]
MSNEVTKEAAVELRAEYHTIATPKGVVDAPNGQEHTATKKENMVSMVQLFRFADTLDVVLMTLGAFAAFATGAAIPLRILLFGDVLTAFNPTTEANNNILSHVTEIALKFVWIGLGIVVTGFIQVACWSITASRQAQRMREVYVRAILTKEIGWFDVNDPGTLATKVAETSLMIQDGLGRKVGDACNYSAMAIAGISIGVGSGWKLGLVVLAFTPVIALGTFIMMKSMSIAVRKSVQAYGKAGAIADEALSNIRTVHMFNAFPSTIAKYESALTDAEAAGVHKGLVSGLGSGLVFFIIFLTYVVGIYYGAVIVANDNLINHCTGSGCYDGGKVLTVFFGVIMGAMSLGQAGPCIEAIVTARAAAYEAYKIIDEPSKIDATADGGITLDLVEGTIELKSVEFAYPSRPHVRVCRGYNLSIAAGEKVALVGPSGSGKSTIVALVERFYDPQVGVVTLDGIDLRQLNVKWLRQQIGLVGQEPCLFAASIANNIRHGMPNATIEQIHDAAKMANAYGFIMEFPHGFDTLVGDRGAQLSGGQKQRIAIARAIVKNPAVLLLDEATSTLDTESERIVQDSLDRLVSMRQRTTIMIAHRLSTIRNADRIVVVDHGQVQEEGSHDELMAMENGIYKRLVRANASITTEGTNAQINEPSAVDKAERDLCHAEVTAACPQKMELLTKPEKFYMLFGTLGASVTGATFPVWGVILSKAIVLFFDFSITADEMKRRGFMWSMYFLALGIAYGVAAVVMHYCFSIVAEKLTTRIRSMGFAAMLRQEMSWFDVNPSGILTTRLATEASLVQNMTADFLKNVVATIVMLVVAFAIAFFYSWEMTLVLLGVFPIMGFASSVRSKAFAAPQAKANHQGDMLAGAVLAESINAIRTVASFGMEEAVNETFRKHVFESTIEDNALAYRLGSIYGVSQGVMFFALAFLFWFGGWLIHNGHITFEAMFMVLMAIMLSSFGVGNAIQSLGGRDKAKRAAANLFATIDRVPAIDSTGESGFELPNVVGTIEFRNLRFAYPSRPNSIVYKNYSLTIPSGTTVALVGASGSGKSTAIGLLERFYDPLEGTIFIDGADIKKLNLHWLRTHVSLVSQEPVLFAGSIRDNIATGKPDASFEDIVAAAKMANAHDFIMRFPDGYDTSVGERGTQVSGGQKQRIAIARAILRDPAVLLLDEATSALDNESERIVQASLDVLLTLKKRTTIIVAHRLSTIRNADMIAVCDDGRIVEQGTHDQLMQLAQGAYKSLVSRQMAQP